MREKRRDAALQDRPAADREQLLRLRAAETLAAPSRRNDRCDVHEKPSLYGAGLRKPRRAGRAEKGAHRLRLALDRPAEIWRRAAEQLHRERRRLSRRLGKPHADDRAAAKHDGRDPALRPIHALVKTRVDEMLLRRVREQKRIERAEQTDGA